jgi:hypothetical protein
MSHVEMQIRRVELRSGKSLDPGEVLAVEARVNAFPRLLALLHCRRLYTEFEGAFKCQDWAAEEKARKSLQAAYARLGWALSFEFVMRDGFLKNLDEIQSWIVDAAEERGY